MVCRQHIDHIMAQDPLAKIIVMGDLNDDPDSPSITKELKATGKRDRLQPGDLYNPWNDLYQQGIGTLANRDAWGLFDQIILSPAWLDTTQKGLSYQNRFIFNPGFMRETNGRFKGYPMRTWDGNVYRGGYSDHFPTYIVLIKSIK